MRSVVENEKATMRLGPTVALVGILSLVGALARADDPVELASGTRVRVTVPTGGGRLIGTVLALDGKNLTLQVSGKTVSTITTLQVSGKTDTTVLRREDITQLAVSAGHRSRGRGALIGAGIGAVIGVSIGLVAGSDGPDSFMPLSAGEKALVGVVLLAPIAAVIGAFHPPERWKELPKDRIHLSFTPVSGRGAAVSLAVAF